MKYEDAISILKAAKIILAEQREKFKNEELDNCSKLDDLVAQFKIDGLDFAIQLLEQAT
ncbi:MAG: hypothetical protein IPQ08_06305 [Chitinophagaceae bacterium]|nr:hypothetical protein [Chitinophagaceae bacterium]